MTRRASDADLAVQPLVAGEVRHQALGRLAVRTPGPGFTDITGAVARFVQESRVREGLAVVFCRHSSASLLINENADPDVQTDLAAALDRLAPREARYVHATEGPDDMPAHIRTMVTGVSLAVPVLDGRLALGTWQGLYLVEHRDRPHARELLVVVTGC